MLTATCVSNGIRLEVFHHAGTQHPNQDRWVVLEKPTGLRIAVIDGATPWHSEPYPGNDAAAWASATVSHYCQLDLAPQEALHLANKALHNPAVKPARRQAMASAAVIDCHIELGAISYTGAIVGDCEIWSRAHSNMKPHLVAGGPAVKDSHLQSWNALRESALPFEEFLELEAQAFDSATTWSRPPVGRYPQVHLQGVMGKGTQLILASDGARISEMACMQDQVTSISAWLEGAGQAKSRDDITCVLIALDHEQSA